MKVPVAIGAEQLKSIHNLIAGWRNEQLKNEGAESYGGIPPGVFEENLKVAEQLRKEAAIAWCAAYRALPEGEEKQALQEEFWGWSDFEDV